VPRVGALESILDLSPDVVLGLSVVAERDPELVRALRSAGVDVYLADPKTVSDVFATARAVATRVREPAAAESLVQRLGAELKSVVPAPERRVFVYDCCNPPFTAGGKTVLTDLIARAGGRNVFADLNADWTHVSWEEVVARRPELIVIHAYQHDGQADVAGKRRALERIPSLARVPTAVLPLGVSLGGIRSIDGLRRLNAALRELS
jgi:iron complex transport system substrate-binding protein